MLCVKTFSPVIITEAYGKMLREWKKTDEKLVLEVGFLWGFYPKFRIRIEKGQKWPPGKDKMRNFHDFKERSAGFL
jgi:hypothetical protein